MADYVHPGRVGSKNDGEVHFVTAAMLCHLYGLNLQKVVIVRGPEGMAGRRRSEQDRHFYPRFDGNYQKVSDRG